MNHRQVLELAGWLAEHGADLVGHCRGIPVEGLRRYLQARQTQFQGWLKVLDHGQRPDESSDLDAEPGAAEGLLTTVRDIAPHSILVRIASTILHSIGKRMDVPFAVDVANRSSRSFARVIQSAMAAVALRTEIPASEWSGLDRLGRHCDRLSDLLCGTLLDTLNCDLFVVDRARAADFAETFGRHPSLVRLPVRKAILALPSESACGTKLADDVERALIVCLPIVVNYRSARTDELSDLAELFGAKFDAVPERNSETPRGASNDRGRPLVFPTLSFARLLRKVRDSRGG